MPLPRWTLCAPLLVAACAQLPPAAEPPASGHYAEVHELHMYYERHGHGAPLLLLHGGLSAIPVWPEALAFFAQHFEVIAPEQMGHGRTADDPNRAFDYHAMAEDTAELLRQLGIGPVCVLGWSDGGILGLDLAIHHPELVRMLAVSGANFSVPPREPGARELGPDDIPAFIREPYLRLSPDGAAHWPMLFARVSAMWRTQPNYTAAQLGSIKAPTLVVAGDRDFYPPEHTVALWRAIPGADLWIAPHSGHNVPQKRAELFQAMVLEFFTRAAADGKH